MLLLSKLKQVGLFIFLLLKAVLEYKMRGKVTFQVPTSINYRILYKEICIVNNVVK